VQGSGPFHPVGPEDRPAIGFERIPYGGIVVDDDRDGPVAGEASYQTALDLPGRPAVALAPHDQSDVGEPVRLQPPLGVAAGPLGPAGQNDDLVVVREQPVGQRETLGQRRVGA